MLDSTTVSGFSETLQNKTVVVDTSTMLLSGRNLLTFLPECTLVVPAIVVKELEDKRSSSTVGFQSREWLRLLEELRAKHKTKLSTGVYLEEPNNIILKVEPNHSNQSSLPTHLKDGSNDSTILAVAKNLANESSEDNVVVMSNDTPMRLHATLDLKLETVEFNSTILLGAKPFNGRVTIELPATEYLSSCKSNEGEFIELVKDYLPVDLASHSLVTVRIEDTQEIVGTLLYSNGLLNHLSRKQKASGIVSKNLEQDVAMDYLFTDPYDLPITSIGGGAGSGKTLLTLAVGLEELKRGTYQKIIVFRSLHEMGKGQELGFLPGNVEEKMEAWAGAVYDALDTIANVSNKNRHKNDSGSVLEESKKLREFIEVSPITYLRGRSLNNAYLVLDEAQNFSRTELLNIISRAGVGTKIVLCSDEAQVDNKFLQSGSKADIWSVVNDLKNEDIFAHVTLQKTERSRVAEIASRILSSSE